MQLRTGCWLTSPDYTRTKAKLNKPEKQPKRLQMHLRNVFSATSLTKRLQRKILSKRGRIQAQLITAHSSNKLSYQIHLVTPSSSSSSFPVSPSSGPGLLESGGVMGGGWP